MKRTNLILLRDTPPWDWPEDAAGLLLDALRDERLSEDDLLLATELSGDFTVIDDELADALLSLLHDANKPEAVRGAAAISLGPALEAAELDDFEFDDSEDDDDSIPISEEMFDKIREALRPLATDPGVPTYVRRRALEAAVRSQQEWQKDVIRTAYAKDDPLWRLTAVFCMRHVKGFEKEILEALGSEDAEVRTEAMLAAGTWGMDRAWRQVVAVLTSPPETEKEKDVLLAAIAAAGLIRPKEAIEVLGDLLDSDDEDVVEAVKEALAMAGAYGDLEDEGDLDAFVDDEDEVRH
jgi:HEAT repeat protein